MIDTLDTIFIVESNEISTPNRKCITPWDIIIVGESNSSLVIDNFDLIIDSNNSPRSIF